MVSLQLRRYSDSAGEGTTKESWFSSRQRQEIIAETTTPPPAPNPRHVHWIPRALYTRINWPGREADPAYSSYEGKNQCTYTPTPTFAVKYTFSFTFISRDALLLSIVVLFLKDSSPLRLVSDCTSRQCRLSHAVQMIFPLLVARLYVFTYVCNYRAFTDTKISLVVSSVAGPPSGPKQHICIISDL